MSVYLICFSEPYHHARHYLGYAKNVQSRYEKHKQGTGAKLLRAVNEANISYEIVRVWKNKDRGFERFLKNKKNSPKLCPRCNSPISKV
jgi:predicted GIY-YIG superfamily endonuclease